GAWHQGCRRADLVLDLCTRRHAAGHHRQVQRQVHRDCQNRRHAEAHARDQRGGALAVSEGDRRISEEGPREQCRALQGSECEAGVMAQQTSWFLRHGRGSLMRRREFLKLTGAAAISGVSISKASAQAETWPNKPVKLILPYAPGGATDLIGRPWAEKLSQVFGQQFVIENRGGAGGMIGTEASAKATPDGYTFLLAPNAVLTILPTLRQAAYDPIHGFEPVGRVGDLVAGFVINPAVGPKTFKEMIEYAKQNPGKLAYGSAGLGTATQLRVEMLKYRAGIDILHVPYRGSADALN